MKISSWWMITRVFIVLFSCDTFLQRARITRMEWPACSPDMNPIQHVCDRLKRAVFGSRQRPRTLRDLRRIAIQEWVSLDQGWLDHLIDDMPRGIQDCLRARGRSTTYWPCSGVLRNSPPPGKQTIFSLYFFFGDLDTFPMFVFCAMNFEIKGRCKSFVDVCSNIGNDIKIHIWSLYVGTKF